MTEVFVGGPFKRLPEGFPDYWVRTRVGWGWEVRGPDGFCSRPLETQQSAIEAAERLVRDQGGAR